MRRTLATLSLAGLFVAGCSSEGRVTNPQAPGPAVGNAVGAGAGAVVGNAAGAVVGFGEGAAAAASQPFKYDPTQRVVRHWHEEKTPDGRTIRVAEDYLVDEQGRIIRRLNDEGK